MKIELMKTKSLLVLVCVSMLSIAPIFGGILEDGYKGAICALKDSAKVYSYTGTGKNSTNIGFSLNNKSENGIYFKIKSGNAFQRAGQSLLNDPEFLIRKAVVELPLDLSKETVLTLYKKNSNNELDKVLTATFPKNKTIYINWDGKNLYKQQGPLGGITGVNDNCYSLKNNIVDTEIVVTRP